MHPAAQEAAAPSKPSSVTVVGITDPTAAREGIEVLEQDIVQLENEPLRAKRVIVLLERTMVIYQSTNLRIRSRTKLSPDFLAFMVPGPAARGTVDGREIRPGQLLVVEPGVEAELVVQARYESVALLVTPEEFEKHLRDRGRADGFRAPRGIEIRRPSVASRELFRLGRRAAKAAAARPEVFDRGTRVRAGVTLELLERLLAILDSVDRVREGSTRRDQTRQNYSRITKAAEDYALARAAEPLSVTDLCGETGASERTLQYAFQEILGLSPISYLIRLRLHRVRHALRTATDPRTRVSSVAMDWGFWHFGDFSRAYKECFGERPSDTLKAAERQLA